MIKKLLKTLNYIKEIFIVIYINAKIIINQTFFKLFSVSKSILA
jgi:hypothetical protein